LVSRKQSSANLAGVCSLLVNFGRSIEFTSKGAKSLGEETRVAAESADILRSVAWKESLMPVGIAISCPASLRASTTLIQSAPPANRRRCKAGFYCAMLLQSAAFAVKFCHSVIILVYTHRDSVKMPGHTATELSMGPFCVTRSNPTYQLTGPTQSITSG